MHLTQRRVKFLSFDDHFQPFFSRLLSYCVGVGERVRGRDALVHGKVRRVVSIVVQWEGREKENIW
jgi:hypothetical protein